MFSWICCWVLALYRSLLGAPLLQILCWEEEFSNNGGFIRIIRFPLTLTTQYLLINSIQLLITIIFIPTAINLKCKEPGRFARRYRDFISQVLPLSLCITLICSVGYALCRYCGGLHLQVFFIFFRWIWPPWTLYEDVVVHFAYTQCPLFALLYRSSS